MSSASLYTGGNKSSVSAGGTVKPESDTGHNNRMFTACRTAARTDHERAATAARSVSREEMQARWRFPPAPPNITSPADCFVYRLPDCVSLFG